MIVPKPSGILVETASTRSQFQLPPAGGPGSTETLPATAATLPPDAN
jgi:hypothetical protein